VHDVGDKDRLGYPVGGFPMADAGFVVPLDEALPW
jgi:hypothetical protein